MVEGSLEPASGMGEVGVLPELLLLLGLSGRSSASGSGF